MPWERSVADDPVAVLTAALQDPDLADRHEQIRAALARRMPVGVGAPDPRAPPAPHEKHLPGERMAEGWDRLKEPVGLAVRLGHRAANAATLGGFDAGLNAVDRAAGTHFGVTNEQQDADRVAHPWMTGTADAIGTVAPTGAPAKAGEVIGRGVDALTGLAAKRGSGGSPGGQGRGRRGHRGCDRRTRPGGRVGLPRRGPGSIGRAALSGAESGAALGAPMGFRGGRWRRGGARVARAAPTSPFCTSTASSPAPSPGAR